MLTIKKRNTLKITCSIKPVIWLLLLAFFVVIAVDESLQVKQNIV
jgi:hypothetical protein